LLFLCYPIKHTCGLQISKLKTRSLSPLLFSSFLSLSYENVWLTNIKIQAGNVLKPQAKNQGDLVRRIADEFADVYLVSIQTFQNALYDYAIGKRTKEERAKRRKMLRHESKNDAELIEICRKMGKK
jgi:hypothetical protein